LTGIKARISAALVVVLASLLVLQPISAVAADCMAEQAAFDALRKEVDKLNDQLNGALRDLDAAQRDMVNALGKIDDAQNSLKGQKEKVQAQMEAQGMWDALAVLGPQVAFSIALALAEPELMGESIHLLLEAAEKVHTAAEVYELYHSAAEAESILDEMAAEMGSLDAAREFAAQHNLTELTYMINKEAELAAWTKDFHKAWGRWEDAADAVVAYTALRDAKAKQLQAAQVALYACLDKATAPPSDPCSGVDTNPNGAGVCR